jgi:hypothetical protein
MTAKKEMHRTGAKTVIAEREVLVGLRKTMTI